MVTRFWHDLRGGAWSRSAFLLWALTVLVLALCIPTRTAQAVEYQGRDFNNAYYYTVVEFFAMPSEGGTITRPNGVNHAATPVLQTPSVPGGAGYFTGTRLTAMAVGYATAPMDFTAVAVPADGFKFSHWQGLYLPDRWKTGGVNLRVSYLESECDNSFGYFGCYAVFIPNTVTINFMPTTGFNWLVPSGPRQFPTVGLTPINVELTAAYAANYEFDTWVRSYSLVAAVIDPADMTTYLDCEEAAFAEIGGETNHWIYPRMKPKVAGDTFEATFTISEPAEGFLHVTSENTTVGVTFHNYWDKSDSDYEFVRWDTTNLACSDRYNKNASFWILTADNATGEAILELNPTREVFALTLQTTGSGSTVPEEGVIHVQENVPFEIRGVPDSGWKFDYWLGLPGGETSHNYKETIALSENTTVTAVFTTLTGEPGTDGPGAAAMGLWGKIRNSLDSVGLDNVMGRMFVILFAMVALVIVARDNKLFRVVLPLAVLGVGIIGGWVPIWIIILLALGVGVFLVKGMSRTAAGD